MVTAVVAAHSDTAVGELIEDLTAIAALPIPYARLPKRAQIAWAPTLHTWADVAAETPATLLARPKAGEALLRALLAAANEAIRAAHATTATDAASSAARLLSRLTERDRIVLAARVWAPQPAITDEVAKLLGTSCNAVWRHQPRAQSRCAELLDDPAHADLKAHGAALHAELGTLTTVAALTAALAELGVDHDSAAGRLLAYVAGPYRRRGGWLEHTDSGAVAGAQAAVLAALERLKVPTTAALVRELLGVGVVGGIALAFLEQCPWARRFGDRWVRWGSTAGDQIEAVLHLSRNPTTAEVIAAVVGQTYSAAVIRSTLFDDDRFIRASQYTWGLREWGSEEYAGIYGEILARLDAVGAISVADLVREMKADFPDISEISIRTYASRPAFVVEDGLLRKRTPRDGWRTVPPLNTTRGVFRNGDNEIRVCYTVDRDLIRGSGQHIAPTVAAALGVSPGEHISVTSPYGELKLAWRLSASRGPSIGSLRVLATEAGAQLGDELVLVFDLHRRSVSTELITAAASLERRMGALLGVEAPDPRSSLARSLSCPVSDVEALLAARGDTVLAAALAANTIENGYL
jgi:hypothetical protein